MLTTVERRYVATHMQTRCSNRMVGCQYCHILGPHDQITGPHHRSYCLKLPLPCPNRCEVGSVPREGMEAHRKHFPLEMIQCEYYSMGCEVRMARMDQEEHMKENMEDYLTMTTRKLIDTNCNLADTNIKLANTESKLTDTNNQLAIALQRISTLEVSALPR